MKKLFKKYNLDRARSVTLILILGILVANEFGCEDVVYMIYGLVILNTLIMVLKMIEDEL